MSINLKTKSLRLIYGMPAKLIYKIDKNEFKRKKLYFTLSVNYATVKK
jgi:hypothetical protein